MDDDDDCEFDPDFVPHWMEYKQDEIDEHSNLVPCPRPADYLAGLAYTILGSKL